MAEQIKNPYIANYGKTTRGWNVLFRYLIAGNIKFKFICSCVDKPTATKIAGLLNKNLKDQGEKTCA